MAFENVSGQERAVGMLRAALRRGWVPHAYLFVGPGGVGCTALARELATILLCSLEGQEACGACENCRAIQTGNHPDYREIGVPEGKQDLPIELIRSLQSAAAVKPVLADRRVFVVREAQRMTIEAANCFLKTLEEPPGACCFLLVATTLWDVPETVVSRCQVVKLAGLPAERVEEQLRAEGVSEQDAHWLARRSWGSPGRARAFLDMQLPQFNRTLARELLALKPEDNFRLSDLLTEATPRGPGTRAAARIMLQEFLECMAVFYRDLAAVALAQGEPELFNADLRDELSQCAAHLSLDEIMGRMDRTLEAIERIGANANSRLVLDDLFSQVAG